MSIQLTYMRSKHVIMYRDEQTCVTLSNAKEMFTLQALLVIFEPGTIPLFKGEPDTSTS